MSKSLTKLQETAERLKAAASRQAGELYGSLNEFYTLYLGEAQKLVDRIDQLEKEVSAGNYENEEQHNLILNQQETIRVLEAGMVVPSCEIKKKAN